MKFHTLGASVEMPAASNHISPFAKFCEFHWQVSARQKVEYDVTLSRDLFSLDNPLIFKSLGTGSVLFVLDSTVDAVYGRKIRDYCAHLSMNSAFEVLSVSESSKTLESVLAVVDMITARGLLRRRDLVVAVGGGVLSDLVGMAASVHRRGVPYVRIPTTLMGLIDASIGVKTGVNYGDHKNRLGTYFAPKAAFLDPSFLVSQDDRHIANGLAEIVKMALAKDAKLFDLLERSGPSLVSSRLQGGGDPEEILRRAVSGMLHELEPNLWEEQLERVVDYGHTFGPALEMAALPELLHGESVSIDMAISLAIAEGRGLLSTLDAVRAIRLLRVLGLPVWHPACIEPLLGHALKEVTRHRDGQQRLPLTHGIGRTVFVNDVSAAEASTAANRARELSDLYEEFRLVA